MSTEPKKRPTIAELEAILNTNESKTVEVLPDGSIIVNDELTALRAQLATANAQLARALEDAEREKGRCGEVFVLLEIVEKYVQRSGHGVPIGIVANTVKARQILSP